MKESLLILWSFPISVGLVYLLLNLMNLSDVKCFYKVSKELWKGDYKYHGKLIDQIIFRRIDDREEMIFFPDGSIKVMDDVYIHKSMLWMSVFSVYYYWKFNRLKDSIIREHTISEQFRQIRIDREERMYNVYVKKHNSPFKFFRG
jgi:hypothetical protein